MVRGMLGVVLGFVVVAGVMSLCLTGAFFALGPDRAFRPGTYEVSSLMTMIAIAVLAVSVVAGGAVCSKVSKSAATPCRILAGMLLVVMLSGALATYMKGPAASRARSAQGLEAMSRAHTPPLAAVINAAVCGSGVLAGGFVARHRK